MLSLIFCDLLLCYFPAILCYVLFSPFCPPNETAKWPQKQREVESPGDDVFFFFRGERGWRGSGCCLVTLLVCYGCCMVSVIPRYLVLFHVVSFYFMLWYVFLCFCMLLTCFGVICLPYYGFFELNFAFVVFNSKMRQQYLDQSCAEFSLPGDF